tara:strand:+ start:155 stop:604 length:450 start_codon:yes stop_codon:yes gene_type:complete
MQILKDLKIIFLLVGFSGQIIFFTPKVSAGSFGAEIFCAMRDGGNDHESSWEAAYSYIKRQKGGIFKVSPKQAAALIIETVVREKDQFSYCIQYLDQLYPDRDLQRELEEEEERKIEEELAAEERRREIEALIEEDESLSEDDFDRYSY